MNQFEPGLTKRYYHFVALKGSRKSIKPEFFKQWKIREKSINKLDDGGLMQVMEITTSFAYYRGESDYSANRDLKPPYVFTLFIIEHQKLNLTLIGFPFRKMAIDLMSSMQTTYKITSEASFVKVNMHKLIRAFSKHTDILHEKDNFTLGGVFISIDGDSFLSSVKLVGNKPLESDIYKAYFKQKLLTLQKKGGLDKCILKSSIGINDSALPLVRSSTHIDKFGNFKLYVHNLATNIPTFHHIFIFLNDFDCLEETTQNPVFHVIEDSI